MASGYSETDGVAIDSLAPGTTVVVNTRNSQYRLLILIEPSLVMVQGGALFPEATIVRLDGATAGGCALTPGWILVGFQMQMWRGPLWIRSSRLLGVSREPHRPLRFPLGPFEPRHLSKLTNLGSVGSQFAHLLRVLPNGRIQFAEDLGEYEADEIPDGGADDSNPYGIAVLPSRTLYSDAGGNALNEVRKNGSISTLAVFPDRNVTHPLCGATVPMQAVPTTVVQGPDDAWYVGLVRGSADCERRTTA